MQVYLLRFKVVVAVKRWEEKVKWGQSEVTLQWFSKKVKTGTVADRMGTTKSAVSRLEGAGKHVPSVASLKKYADAVGCRMN